MVDMESLAQTNAIESCLTLEQVNEIQSRRRGRVFQYVDAHSPIWQCVCRVTWRLYNRELDLRNEAR